MARNVFAPQRRRRSPFSAILMILLLLILALLVFAWWKDKEVPLTKIEQDVTNEVLAR